MTTFRRVLFWPTSKFLDREWSEDADEAAWLGTSRRVCEAYSVGLEQGGLPGRHSELRLITEASSERLGEGGRVRAEVSVDRFEGFEMGRVHVPRGIARLSAEARAELVLETVHRLAVTLGGFRGWDAEVLQTARDRAAADRCVYGEIGDWKSSPGRRRRARMVFELADDGNGRVVLEVAGPDGVVTSLGPAYGFGSPEGFRRARRTLRWQGKDQVELIPYVAPFEPALGMLRWQADGPGLVELAAPPTPARPANGSVTTLPAEAADLVVVRPIGDSLPDQPSQIKVIGGGPMNDVPRDYEATLRRLLRAVTGPAWQTWWAASDETVLEIWYDFVPRAAGVRIRRGRNSVKGSIDRPTPTMIAVDDPAELARKDVVALMTAVQQRFQLGPLPPLDPGTFS